MYEESCSSSTTIKPKSLNGVKIADLVPIKIDLIFNLIHGSLGENGQLSALWELLEIPFTSCSSYNAALTLNKRDCLSVLREWNIPTAKHYTLDKGDDLDPKIIIDYVGLPCFVKANRSGSSFGVYKVYKKNDLIDSIEKAFEEPLQGIGSYDSVNHPVLFLFPFSGA